MDRPTHGSFSYSTKCPICFRLEGQSACSSLPGDTWRGIGNDKTFEKTARVLVAKIWEGLAERVGFEPTVGINLHTLSKRAP